jgi:hypothetical protein
MDIYIYVCMGWMLVIRPINCMIFHVIPAFNGLMHISATFDHGMSMSVNPGLKHPDYSLGWFPPK